MENKEPTLKESFEEMKRLANHWGASKADVITNDGEWEYTIAVKRLKK